MKPNQEFGRIYRNVSESIAGAMANIAELKVNNEDGKQQLSGINEKLRIIQANFDGELTMLEENAEWEKFTMAFFGETNAGKSTIIESLRILFEEESRQVLLEQNAYDLQRFEQELTRHVNTVRNSLNDAYNNYAYDIEKINSSISSLANVVREESSKRVKKKVIMASVVGAVIGSAFVGIVMSSLIRGLI
ncbi:hypothetical protein [Methylomonas koyamae]|jgi:hypothetical protein|uniref:G domain-containing protein n=1 Tax=Methylomonas koyamae TaxID=702114 RepID=A0AA91DCL1_9GAMM|nr:hypothetical protein [Methylomonas koyamae]OAI26192.1 hypothetical protein A1356_11885 [Methylomonas koyamae]